MIRYRHSFGGGFLLEPAPELPSRWRVIVNGSKDDKQEIIGFFDSAEEAVLKLTTFQTGNILWDKLPVLSDAMGNRLTSKGLSNLQNWEREET
jgi:hypothetical protein